MRPQPGIWVISSSRPRAPVRMVTMRKAAAHLAAEQTREAVTAARAEATAANTRAESASAEVERVRQDAEPALGELRASMPRERAGAQRDAATAQAGAEPERIRADFTWRREELRQVLDGRASVLEEARAELPARAGRPGRELDHLRAERGGAGPA
jgi:hypothetical protein